MTNQLKLLKFMVTAIAVCLLGACGCSRKAHTMNAVDKEIVNAIVRDLDLPDSGTDVVQFVNEGEREEAIVLTSSSGQYTLWYVYRSPGDVNRNGDWRLWINYDVIDDGTGAEVPAKRQYSVKPNAATIAAFKSEILNH